MNFAKQPTPAPSQRTIKVSGWLASLLGLLLIAGMGGITINLAPSMLHRTPGFSGTTGEGVTYLMLFGLVILFGINVLIAGILMIRTGRRNRWATGTLLVIIALIAGLCWNVLSDNQSDRAAAAGGKGGPEFLTDVASGWNRGLPRVEASYLRLDSAVAGPGNKIALNYTLIGELSQGKIDSSVQTGLLSAIKAGDCKERMVQEVLQTGATVEYKYLRSDGRVVLTIPLTAAMCR